MQLTFVPLPLASGDEFVHPETGAGTPVTSVILTLTLADGTQVRRALLNIDSRWWFAG